MKTFEQVKPILRKFIEKNKLVINEAGATHNLEQVLDELQFDDMIGPEEANIIAFYFIACLTRKPLQWMDLTDLDLLQKDDTFEIFIYEPGYSSNNGWSSEFKFTDFRRFDQIAKGDWIKKIQYPIAIEKVLLDAKQVLK